MQNKYSGRFEASPINAPIAEAEDNLMSNIDAMELASPPPPIEPEPSPMVA